MKLTKLSPLLETTDIKSTISFYTGILGFTVRGSLEQEGTVVWCDLVKDDVALMFGLPNEHMAYGKIMLSGSLYINTDGVDELWNAVKDFSEVVYPPENFEYGMREFAIKDNNGYVLNFGESIN